MARRSKSKRTDEPALLTCQEIMQQYGLARATIELLVAQRLLLDWTPRVVNGVARYPVTPENDFVLRAGSLHPPSFPGYRPPFLRFLILKMLTSSDASILAELLARGLPAARVTEAVIAAMRARITARLPDALQGFINAAPPDDDQQERLLRVILRIAGIEAGYDQPVTLDTYYFTEDLAHALYQISATGACPADAVAACTMSAGREIFTSPAFSFFRLYFADFRIQDQRSLSWFLQNIPPRVRSRYQLAMTSSLDEFLVKIQAQADLKANLRVAGVDATRLAISQLQLGTPDAVRMSASLISSSIRIFDAIGEITPATNLPPSYEAAGNFEATKFATYPFAERFPAAAAGAAEGVADAQ